MVTRCQVKKATNQNSDTKTQQDGMGKMSQNIDGNSEKNYKCWLTV